MKRLRAEDPLVQRHPTNAHRIGQILVGTGAMTISGAGAIPYRLRVGVIGHRRLPDDARLVEQVGRALGRVRQLVPSSPDTPIRLAIPAAAAVCLLPQTKTARPEQVWWMHMRLACK